MAVALALGVLATNNIVQSANIIGCSNCTSSSNEDIFREISELSNLEICQIARSNKGKWETNSAVKEYVREAAKRNIDCGVNQKNPFIEKITNYSKSVIYKYIPDYWCETFNYYLENNDVMPVPTTSTRKCPGKKFLLITKDEAIEKFTTPVGKNWLCKVFENENDTISFLSKNWDYKNAKVFKTENKFSEKVNAYIQMASLINLNCKNTSVSAGLGNNDTKVVIKEYKESKKLAEQEREKRIELEKKLAELEKQSNTNVLVENETSKRLAEEEKQRRLKEQKKRIELEKKLAALEKEAKNKTNIEEISKRLAEEEKQKRLKEEQLRLETEQKRKELEEKLAILSKKKNVNVDKLVEDNQAPVISAQSKQDGFYATISGTITDDVKLAEVLIDNKLITPKEDGTFNTKLYVPRNGLEVKILAFDMKGNKSTKTLKVERGAIEEASGPVFASLDPSAKKVKSNPDALALIVGVADYEKTNADAIYADKDAQQFYDYARMKLGIPAKNIKELLNDNAEYAEIILTTKNWLRRTSKANKSDIYIYFAGHGLASDDGQDMYLLPYDGRPGLLDKTALLRDELFTNIQQANPRSVTVFLDTCYSGTTRGTDMLIASRPIAIRALEQSIPSNFTVFSAAAGDQTSKPLEEAKHGMFSYFLMKGMEGDADSNNDNKITARELHAYVEQNVVQQSSGSQTPELQGDKDRVLVQFN